MNHSDPNPSDPALSQADAQALDALVEAGFDLSLVSSSQRARAEKVARVLGLLDTGSDVSTNGMVDRVWSAIQATSEPEARLCPQDEKALQALADAEFVVADVPAEHVARAARHAAVANLVASKPVGVEWSPDLAAKTFDLVMLMDESGPIPIEREIRRGGVGRRFWDVVAVAATLMLGASVLLPIMAATRARQTQIACFGRLGEVASAMSAYANANQNALPAATASFGGTYWNTGKDPRSSNSANLFTLVREGYAKLRSLTCPAHEVQLPECMPASEPDSRAWDWPEISHVSYSYQVMAGPNRPRWNDTVSVAILADRSPVVIRSMRKERVHPLENSPNHDGRGQSVLFIDGQVRWLTSPVLGFAQLPPQGGSGPLRVAEDNIWFPWQVEEILRRARAGEEITLQGSELPTSPFDTFLAP